MKKFTKKNSNVKKPATDAHRYVPVTVGDRDLNLHKDTVVIAPQPYRHRRKGPMGGCWGA
jgi:hypothetical protein